MITVLQMFMTWYVYQHDPMTRYHPHPSCNNEQCICVNQWISGSLQMDQSQSVSSGSGGQEVGG